MALPLGTWLRDAQDALKLDPMLFLAQTDAVRMKEQATPFDAKVICWIATAATDPDGYVSADIEGTSGDMVQISVKGEKREIKKEECDQMNPPKYEKCTDMSNLTFLSEASVLYNLKSRYAAGLIYTYSGLFCVAVNPYRRLPIYTQKVIDAYKGRRKTEMPPHLFSVSDNAYQAMLQDRENQSMLITGESGAGKTE